MECSTWFLSCKCRSVGLSVSLPVLLLVIGMLCVKNVTLSFSSACSMDGADLCFEIVKRADAGFVYSEAVARYVAFVP